MTVMLGLRSLFGRVKIVVGVVVGRSDDILVASNGRLRRRRGCMCLFLFVYLFFFAGVMWYGVIWFDLT